METEKHVIWSDLNLDYKEWKKDLEAEYPECTEDERIMLMYSINADYLNDERSNLNIQLSMPILVCADLELWNGRKTGYKMIDSGNIGDCLSSECDYNEWFLDKEGDLRCTAVHHDGTNHYLYRAIKEGTPDWKIAQLQDRLYFGKATEKDIAEVTCRLGDNIAAVYGFDIPKMDEKRSFGQEPDCFQSGKALTEFLKTTFPITEVEGNKLIDYMEGHGFLLGCKDGELYRGDLCYAQEEVQWEPYSIYDAVDSACEWNYELIKEMQTEVENIENKAEYEKGKRKLASLQEDEKILDVMFDRTKYGKELEKLAEILVEELIQNISREGGIDAAVSKMSAQIKEGTDLLPGVSTELKQNMGRSR